MTQAKMSNSSIAARKKLEQMSGSGKLCAKDLNTERTSEVFLATTYQLCPRLCGLRARE